MSSRMKLSWDCEEQLFRKEMEDADDMRLSVRLFRKCLQDKRQFCDDVPPGNAMAKECLEEHRDELSDGCRWARECVDTHNCVCHSCVCARVGLCA